MYLINTNIWNTCKILPTPSISLTFTIPITQKYKTDLCLWVCRTLVGNLSLRETMKPMIGSPSTRFMVDGLSIGNTLVIGQLLACCTSHSVCNGSFFVLKLLCSDLRWHNVLDNYSVAISRCQLFGLHEIAVDYCYLVPCLFLLN